MQELKVAARDVRSSSDDSKKVGQDGAPVNVHPRLLHRNGTETAQAAQAA